MNMYAYLEYRDIFRRPAHTRDIIRIVGKYCLRDWFHLVSKLEYLHEHSEVDFHAKAIQDALVMDIFPQSIRRLITTFERTRDKAVPLVVFTYSHVINLRRLAISHSPPTSAHQLTHAPVPVDVAIAFLQLNELSDTVESTGERSKQDSITREYVLELLIRQFYFNHRPIALNLMGRTEFLYFILPRELTRDADYVEIESGFLQHYGVSIKDCMSIVWAFTAQWAGAKGPWGLGIDYASYLRRTALDMSVVTKTKSLVASNPQNLKTRIANHEQRFPSHWPYGLLPMYETPFLEPVPGKLTLLGLAFAYSKMTAGIYYMCEGALPSDKFPPFFGKLCQRYFELQCEKSCGVLFQKERKYEGDQGKVHGPDGMIESGSTLYILEVKSSPLRLVTSTTGNLKDFIRDGERHGFIEGANQLDGLISHFREGRFTAFEKDQSHYTRIVPIVVTFQPLPQNHEVVTWMLEQVADRGFLKQPGVAELQFMSFEELEGVCAIGKQLGFGAVVDAKMAHPRYTREGFHEYLRVNHNDCKNELVAEAADRFLSDVTTRVLGTIEEVPRLW